MHISDILGTDDFALLVRALTDAIELAEREGAKRNAAEYRRLREKITEVG
ncbi:MAG: hypothetical protein ACXQTD_05925 [Candidatus Syntropharchaeia archaeon]